MQFCLSEKTTLKTLECGLLSSVARFRIQTYNLSFHAETSTFFIWDGKHGCASAFKKQLGSSEGPILRLKGLIVLCAGNK